MIFVSTVPPKYDCEIFNEVSAAKAYEGTLEFNKDKDIDFSDKYLVFVRI